MTRADAIKRLAVDIVQHVGRNREDEAAGLTSAAFAVAQLCKNEGMSLPDLLELVTSAGHQLELNQGGGGHATAKIVGMVPFARKAGDLPFVVFIPEDLGLGAVAVVNARALAAGLRDVATEIDEEADGGLPGGPVGKA